MDEPLNDGRVVVITGGSDGIGAAAARVLARRGDRIVLVGRSAGKTRSVSAQTGAESHVADFADLVQVRELAAGLARRHPRIDVLVNNAGLIDQVAGPGHRLDLYPDLTAALAGPRSRGTTATDGRLRLLPGGSARHSPGKPVGRLSLVPSASQEPPPRPPA